MKNSLKFCFPSTLLVSMLALFILCFTQTAAHAGVSVGIGLGGRWHHGDVAISGYFPLRHYYENSYYYQPYYQVPSYTYILETAPIGAVVYAIPAGCRQFIINGTTYFEYNGTYYVPVAGGYQVVPPPVILQAAPVVLPPADITTVTASANSQESFTVNVPNSQGGYTPVSLTRSGSGFIGPQGEFYNEFPKIEQLRVMYTK